MSRMKESIDASCCLFACVYCRTKNGFAHQKWCVYADKTKPECADCLYYDVKRGRCSHLYLKRGKESLETKNQNRL